MENIKNESYEQQTKDSDMIFKQISTSAIDNFVDAEKLLVTYIMDMSISRAGISHARERLQKFYQNKRKMADKEKA